MYKLGDRVRFNERLHGHDSRRIHGVIAQVKTDCNDDTYYLVNWDGGGHDYLYACEFEPDPEEVYLAEVRWDVSTAIGTNRGNAVVGLYRSVNTTKVIDKMVARVTDITGANIDRSRVHGHTNHNGSLEVTYSVGGCNIIGFVSKMPIKEE